MNITQRGRLRLIALSAVLTLTVVLAGCGGGDHHYKTTVQPPLSRVLAPPVQSCPHTMGGCLPHPKPGVVLKTPRTVTAVNIVGPDLSNNDPIFTPAGWAAIARHPNGFVYLKSIEGTGFTDSTAGAMRALAQTERLPVGGYDFLHVCLVSATGEAQHFVSSLHAQGLLGAGTVAPAGDAEYPLGGIGCNGRTWIQDWVTAVYNADGHICPILYTGAWWWNPHIGAFWPTCAGRQLRSWISGYGVSFPSLPSGLVHLGIWQFTDHGYNGASFADLSQWRDSTADFAQFAHPTPPGPSGQQLASWARARDSSLRAYKAKHCTMPVLGPAACRTFAGRVIRYATIYDTAKRSRPHCWGKHANVSAPECQIVRSEVSVWSHARTSSYNAAQAHGCGGPTGQTPLRRPDCDRFRQRARYFDTRARVAFKAWE